MRSLKNKKGMFDFLGKKILKTTPELPSGLGNYFVCKRFGVQTLLWSLKFVIQIDFKHNTIAVIHFI